MVEIFFNDKSDSAANTTAKTVTVAGKGVALSETFQQLANELLKTIIQKFQKCKVHSSFMNIIWGAIFLSFEILLIFYSK